MPTLPVSYTTVDDMIDTFPAINSITNIASREQHFHAGHAEAIINSAISRRYNLPLSGSYPILTAIATDFAVFRIISTFQSLTVGDGDRPFYQRFKQAKELLKKLVTGEMMLVNSAGVIEPGRDDVGEVWSTTEGYTPTMAEIPFSEQFVDPDKIENERDKRDKRFP